MANSYDYDLFVIGAGSAGVRLARTAAGLGAKVAVAESHYLGGTCVNVGCVPKKMMVNAARFAREFREGAAYGWTVEAGGFNWPAFRTAKDREIARLNSVYQNLLEKAGVTVLRGRATFVDEHTVECAAQKFHCRNIVIATGGWPRKASYPGAELVANSNDVFHLDELPKRVVIEGGGFIAVEFASIFCGLGCETEILYRGPLFLRGFADSLRERLAQRFRAAGIRVSFASNITAVAQNQQGEFQIDDSQGKSRTADFVLGAIGRVPNVAHLGLEQLALKRNEGGTVCVNHNFQTSVGSVYALGDVVGRKPLTPVALAEGTALAHHLVNGADIALDYASVPAAVFTDPEIATVGMTQDQAREQGVKVRVYTSEFTPLKHSISGLPAKTFMELVVDQLSGRVLGCHMLGDNAAEMMQGLAIAVRMGARKSDFDRTIGIHPTSAEEWVTMK